MELITHKKFRRNVGQMERAAGAAIGAGLLVWGARKRGLLTSIAGAELLRRSATGHCYGYDLLGITTASRGQGAETTSVPYTTGIRVDEEVYVSRRPEEVYAFWRDFTNLPKFMKHLEKVEVLGENRTRWTAKAPAGRKVEWEAETINDIPGKLIAWRSLPGADVTSAGSVHFDSYGSGTIVRVELQYNPPAGVLGAMVARLFGEEPSQQIRSDLRRLCQAFTRSPLEAGL